MSENNEIVLGIDLGTSNSAACIYKDGKTTIVPSAEGASIYGKAFPSFFAVTKDGKHLVGEPAKKQAVTNPEGTVSAIKRRMGTDYTVNLHGKEFTPQEISAKILEKIKRDAETFLAREIDKAVITVPAYFNENQRTATKDAAELAGFEVSRLVSEPTAASLAYGIDKDTDDDLNILVFDLGGGTLDVTIMEFGSGVFEVQATSGDTALGGVDMDNIIITHIAKEFEKETGIDLLKNSSDDDDSILKDAQTERRIREAAEKAKIELSNTIETEINLPFIALDSDSKPLNLITTINQAKLESLVRPLVNRCGKTIDKALEVAELTNDDIDKVILVGGPTRMPIVQKFVEEYTGVEIERGIDPMECVAQGASILGDIVEGGGSTGGGGSPIVVIDKTPFNLGTTVADGSTAVLIEENSSIPISRSEIFTTVYDNQDMVICEVVQGPYKMSKDNIELGSFELTGIPPARRGVPQIEVTFELDANAILVVTAKELATGHEETLTIKSGVKLTDEEKERIKREFEEHREEDEKNKKLATSINDAQRVIMDAEGFIDDDELMEKVDVDQIEEIQSIISELKIAINDEDLVDIKLLTKKLSNKIADVGSTFYS